MAVTPNLGLSSPLASAVSGWIARLKADLNLIDQAFAGVAGGGANLLTNPGFELAQRNSGPFTGHGTWTLDRWQIIHGGAVTLAVSRETGSVDAGSVQSAKCVFTLGAGSIGTLEQQIERWAQYLGRTMAFRARVKCSTPNAARVFLGENVGDSSRSGFHSGGGGWETLSVTRTLDAAGTALRCGLYLTADCTAYIDNASLVLGGAALPHAPLDPATDRQRVQRYYEVHIPNATGGDWPYFRGYASAGGEDVIFPMVPWQVLKATVVPTLIISAGGWTGANTPNTAPVLVSCNDQGYVVKATSTAAGPVSIRATYAGGQGFIAGESNP